MRPTYAKRKTNCSLCGDIIEPGEPRLDDITRKNGKPIRLHYHLNHYITYITRWFDENIYEPEQGRGGRPGLEHLTDEQRKTRQKLLTRLSALKAYYLPKDGPPLLNLQGDITTLTPLDLKRFKNYQTKFESITGELQQLGGVPGKYGVPPVEALEEVPV